MGEGEQHALSRSVYAAEARQAPDGFVPQVDSVVGILGLIGWEIGENVNENLVRKLEYCGVVVVTGRSTLCGPLIEG